MKKISVFTIFAVLVIVSGCASKKGAYQATAKPEPIIKEIIKTDTVVIIKRDTILIKEVETKTDTVFIEKEAPKEDIKIVLKEEKFNLAEGESNVEVMKKLYHIVVGSFKSKENAQKRQNEFKPAYNPTLVINEQGMYRVILLSFNEYDSAKTALKDMKGTLPADAWVLVQKK